MKKSIVALAVLGSFAGVAAAQSSVTLFGVLDAAVRYTSANGQDLYSLASGGSSTSRFGVRGVEDLGGGLKAGFWLESHVNVDGGSADATRFWSRRATVSLIYDSMGEVRLGRFKTSVRLQIEDFDPTATTGLGATTNVYSNLGSGADMSRRDNQVTYILPSKLGGFYGSVDVSAGEGTSAINKDVGGRVGYKAGAFNVGAAYSVSGVSTKYKLMSLGGSFDFGFMKAFATYSTTEFGIHSQDIYNLSVTAPLGAGLVWAGYTAADYSSDTATKISGDSSQIAAGYIHNLSKRTALYTTVSYIDNKAGANFSLNGNAPAVGRGGRSGGFDVGVRHSF